MANASMDGDWLLAFEGGEPERFTIDGDNVSSEKGGTALMERTADRFAFELQDGRTISLVSSSANSDVLSATVTQRFEDDEWSDPASWSRVR